MMSALSATTEKMARTAGRSAFGIDAAGYHAGRIGYPDDLIDALFARCEKSPDILEIGAGTGHATMALLARDPASLVALEPDVALVDYLRESLPDPRFRVVPGAFPETPVDGPFDMIVAASCFHWMEPQDALAAARALLRPGGIWAMWWNSYRNPGMGDPLADAISPLIADLPMPPSQSLDRHYAIDVQRHRQSLEDAGFVDIRHHIYRRERTIDAGQARALHASYSFIRLVPEPQQTALLDEIARLVDREFDGRAPNIVLTAVYSAQSPERAEPN